MNLQELAVPGFRIEAIEQQDEQMIIQAQSMTQSGVCPDCKHQSHTKHGSYVRSPHDLSWLNQTVRLQLQVYRFRCLNCDCRRVTFVERRPDFVPFRAQRTGRLLERLRQVALALGGEAGGRLLAELHLRASPDTLLRLIRKSHLPRCGPIQHLGVDDWAWRKGHHYGTILVDLDQHQVIDLLPDREADTLATWLQAHPEIEIISRDRAGAYAEGARQGAPQAKQVADRWHLLKNLGEALTRAYENYRHLLQDLQVPSTPQRLTSPPTPAVLPVFPTPVAVKRALSAIEKLRQQRRAYWLEKFEEVHTLHRQGLSIAAIVRQSGLARTTVRKYLRLTSLPPKTSPKLGPRLIDPYRDYLHQRLAQEPVSSYRLWAEIQAQGFTGGHSTVYACVTQLRQHLGQSNSRTTSSTSPLPPTKPLTARQLVFSVLARPDTRSEAVRQLIDQVCQLHPDLKQITDLAQKFTYLLRTRQAALFDPWLDLTISCQFPNLKSFAIGLRQDYEAVKAALSLPWSNGQVEGQVNRLKFIKRQMYGRANFDLLRLRVLLAH